MRRRPPGLKPSRVVRPSVRPRFNRIHQYPEEEEEGEVEQGRGRAAQKLTRFSRVVVGQFVAAQCGDRLQFFVSLSSPSFDQSKIPDRPSVPPLWSGSAARIFPCEDLL